MSFGANISDDMAAADGASALGACMELVRVVASGLAMDEPMVRYQSTARARTRLTFIPEGTGVNISSTLPDYNHFLGGVDHFNTLRVPKQQCEGEDVL